MNEDILDADHFNPDAWDSKKRIRISDAIIEFNDNLRRMLLGQWVLIALVFLSVFGMYLSFNAIYDGIGQAGTTPNVLSPQVKAGAIKVLLISAAFTVVPQLMLAVAFRRSPVLCLGLALGFYLLGQFITYYSGGAWAVTQGYAVKAAIITALAVPLYCGVRWRQSLVRLRELGYSTTVLTEARKRLKPIARLRKKK